MKTNKVAEALRIEFPDYKGTFPEFILRCPKCEDHKYRLGVNVLKMTGQCFRCEFKFNRRGIEDLVGLKSKRIFSGGGIEALEHQISYVTLPPEPEILENKIELEAVSMTRMIQLEDRKQSKPFWPWKTFGKAWLYLLQRGFEPISMAAGYGLLIGKDTSREAGRLIIPVYEGKELVYFQARTLYKSKMKYLNPNDKTAPLGKNNFVFNLDVAAEFPEIIICEGFFSAIAVGLNAVAIMGKTIGAVQVRKILAKKPKRVTVLLDPGAELQARKVAKEFLGKVGTVRVAELKNGDPNEVSEAELAETLRTAKAMDFLEASIFG